MSRSDPVFFSVIASRVCVYGATTSTCGEPTVITLEARRVVSNVVYYVAMILREVSSRVLCLDGRNVPDLTQNEPDPEAAAATALLPPPVTAVKPLVTAASSSASVGVPPPPPPLPAPQVDRGSGAATLSQSPGMFFLQVPLFFRVLMQDTSCKDNAIND